MRVKFRNDVEHVPAEGALPQTIRAGTVGEVVRMMTAQSSYLVRITGVSGLIEAPLGEVELFSDAETATPSLATAWQRARPRQTEGVLGLVGSPL